jgi:ribosomal-protein-alanine N-acetyltransferase
MKIRNAKIEDSAQIDSLNEKYFHERERDYKEILGDSDNEMYIADENGKIVGFSGITRQTWNNTAHGINIFVHPNYRRKGIGQGLVKEMIEGSKKMKVRSLIVEAPSKSSALPLFLNSGFRKCGYNDRYYSNTSGESAIFLSFDL